MSEKLMRILTQDGKMSGYHGTVGTPTNMYDIEGNRLYVGDVIGMTTRGINGKIAYAFGIGYVCEENTDIASWTGKNHRYVMGVSSTFSDERFSALENVEYDSDKWWEALYGIVEEWALFRVKSYEDLVVGEKVGFLRVAEVIGGEDDAEKH